MTVEQILAFNLVLAAAIASPGRKAGVAVGFGLGAMAAAWTAMALVGLGGLGLRLFLGRAQE